MHHHSPSSEEPVTETRKGKHIMLDPINLADLHKAEAVPESLELLRSIDAGIKWLVMRAEFEDEKRLPWWRRWL